jgi:hypothetical protein
MTLAQLYKNKETVKCYWNFHKKIWSVLYKGRVVDHALSIHLSDVKWVVQPAGNAKVRKEGRKNVHAFCQGRLIGFSQIGMFQYSDRNIPVTYNPYKHETFVLSETHNPIYFSKTATLSGKNVYASFDTE